MIVEIWSPQNINEVQQLIGCLTALSRFVPRLVKRTRPMVQLLYKASKFNWDEKCEEIFRQLKDFLSSPAVIQKSRPYQPIVIFLTVCEEAVSASLVQKEENKKRRVYIVSRTLHAVR